jgi:hypothetical protein
MSPLAGSLLLSALVGAVPTDAAAVSAQLDQLLVAEWKKQGLAPEPAAEDAVFLRRVWLDLAGRVPPALKARAFLDDSSPSRRMRLVESLLAGDEFADHWGRVWAEWLTNRRPFRQDNYDGRVLHEYLSDGIRDGRSYRQTAIELICGSGMTDASGPANFLARYEAKPASLAGAVGKQFLGVSLECAQCHNHPFAHWKQDDFWGVAAYFGRLRLLQSANEDTGEQNSAVLEARRGELMLPDPTAKPDMDGNRPKRVVKPRLPIKDAPAAAADRRRQLAEWVTADANPYFARHAVNRVWAQLFGGPLVHSLDVAVDGAGVRRDVLNLLAADFTANGCDLKRLVRILVNSRAYQLGNGSQPTKDHEGEAEHRLQAFARFPVRPLSVDQLYQSIAQATGHHGDEGVDPQAREQEEEEGPPDRPTDLLGERALSLQRTLALLNGEYVTGAVKAGAAAATAVNGGKPGADHVEWLFLTTLSRRPSKEEARALLELMRAGKGKRGLEDVLWVLLNSAEFGTNH